MDRRRYFKSATGLLAFSRDLTARTGREWGDNDLRALYGRVRVETEQQFREHISYEELLKLLWQVPLECVYCHKKPPEVVLHVDHVIPASKGGPSKRSNLQLLCAADNLAKSDKREVKPWLTFQ